jgi:DNA-binding LytR/AlgR family response regulator
MDGASILVPEDAAAFVASSCERGEAQPTPSWIQAMSTAVTLLSGNTAFDLLIAKIVVPLFQPHGISVGNIAMVRRHGIKVIYITGDPGHVPSGFIDVTQTPLLAKPFDADILLAVVESALWRPK